MFKLQFSTPEKKVVTDLSVLEVTVPAFMGELNILPGHAPLMTTLTAGILKYKQTDSTVESYAISWGYCQINPEGINILAETAVQKEEINIQVVEQHLRENQEKLLAENLEPAQWEKTQREVARLQAEVELSKA